MSTLPEGYEIRQLSREDFTPLWQLHSKSFFEDQYLMVQMSDFSSQEEKDASARLKARLGDAYRLNLGLYHRTAAMSRPTTRS
jgi:hypothetical protein